MKTLNKNLKMQFLSTYDCFAENICFLSLAPAYQHIQISGRINQPFSLAIYTKKIYVISSKSRIFQCDSDRQFLSDYGGGCQGSQLIKKGFLFVIVTVQQSNYSCLEKYHFTVVINSVRRHLVAYFEGQIRAKTLM